MNILFFLTPKAMCAYIEAGDTLRQAMERMEHSGYAALPVIDKSGKYCGVVTEGDLLWTIKRLCVMDLRQTEEHSISEIEHRRTVQPVRVDTRVEDLLSVAAEQNFVPGSSNIACRPASCTNNFPVFLFKPPGFGSYLASEVQTNAKQRKPSESEADPELFPGKGLLHRPGPVRMRGRGLRLAVRIQRRIRKEIPAE